MICDFFILFILKDIKTKFFLTQVDMEDMDLVELVPNHLKQVTTFYL